VTLRDAFNNVIASAVTDGTGSFSFSGLGSGTYTLTHAQAQRSPSAKQVSRNIRGGVEGYNKTYRYSDSH